MDAAAEAAIDAAIEGIAIEQTKEELDKDSEDAIYALRGLGFTQNEAVKAVKAARPKARDLQELIALSLRSLN